MIPRKNPQRIEKTDVSGDVNRGDKLTPQVDNDDDEPSTCDYTEIAARMKAAREALGLSQARLCEKIGYKLRTYQKNEAGSEAKACLLQSLIKTGVNANWLLTGEGPMLLAELGAAAAPKINVALLAAIIKAAFIGIPTAPPEVMAEDVAEFYEKVATQGEAKEA